MPELAEVEYYRKQWDPGLNRKVVRVLLHADKRPFRGTDTELIEKHLPGCALLSSEARAKQMLFRFSKGRWLGIHLGMTGKLSTSKDLSTPPEKHDHLVIEQKGLRLIFNDMRQFGRVLYHEGTEPPEWWVSISPAVTSDEFTLAYMTEFLERHGRIPIKGALLLQSGFPGVGNWMADEILWRARINPKTPAGKVKKLKQLWETVRFVCSEALQKVGADFSDPPEGWLFHERWKRAGICPLHKSPLKRSTIAGRTTAWCPKCQEGKGTA
jgi:formamidopyrimidine-DNA glycosylase